MVKTVTDLDDIYSTDLLRIAAEITHIKRLEQPDVTATAHSKLCGSTLSIDLKVRGGVVVDYGQDVQACLLGQSAAAIVAKHMIGSRLEELSRLGQEMRAMIYENAEPPTGKWQELALLRSVHHFKARHASTLLIFEALDQALDQLKKKERNETMSANSFSDLKENQQSPVILTIGSVQPRKGTIYPAPYHVGFEKRLKRALTSLLGLTQFGVNITTLEPGAMSAHRHWHEKEDEFIYILEGEITLITDAGENILTAGMVTAFPAGKRDGHHLVNKTSTPATYLEVGTRSPEDRVTYPDIDLKAEKMDAGGWVFSRKDGTPYP